jgi:hypothetical protein
VAPTPQLPTLSPAAAADEPGARPRLLVPEEEAAGCNVVELQELVLRAAPQAYKAAAAAAQGRLSLTAGAWAACRCALQRLAWGRAALTARCPSWDLELHLP